MKDWRYGRKEVLLEVIRRSRILGSNMNNEEFVEVCFTRDVICSNWNIWKFEASINKIIEAIIWWFVKIYLFFRMIFSVKEFKLI